jgi:hypothetical protein
MQARLFRRFSYLLKTRALAQQESPIAAHSWGVAGRTKESRARVEARRGEGRAEGGGEGRERRSAHLARALRCDMASYAEGCPSEHG